MKRGGLSGWQKKNRGEVFEIHPMLTRWERFLFSLGLTHESAVSDARVRAWVRRNIDSAYVPESIKEAMGCKSRWD